MRVPTAAATVTGIPPGKLADQESNAGGLHPLSVAMKTARCNTQWKNSTGTRDGRTRNTDQYARGLPEKQRPFRRDSAAPLSARSSNGPQIRGRYYCGCE